MFNGFKGIRPLVNGLVDAEYVNCVPTGTSVVDRTCYVVEEVFPSIASADRHTRSGNAPNNRTVNVNVGFAPWNYFQSGSVECVNSFTFENCLYRIYLSNSYGITLIKTLQADKDPHQYMYVVKTDLTTKKSVGVATPVVYRNVEITTNKYVALLPRNWAWCVSGTKPRQMYLTWDGVHIYWINVDSFDNIKCLLGNYNSANLTNYRSDVDIFFNYDFFEAIQYSSVNNTPSMCWYDNKLCLVNPANGVLNMTCTDPAQYYRNLTDTSTSQEWNKYGIMNFWINWYASTLSSDTIEYVFPAFGQLMFVNKNSIEMWTRTGTEAAPLNNVSNYVSNLSIKVITQLANDIVAVASENGSLGVYAISSQNAKKISNPAVEKYLDSITKIDTIFQNNEAHIQFISPKNEIELCYNPNGETWYVLEDNVENQPVTFIDREHICNASGNICSVTSRILDYSKSQEQLLNRKIVDCCQEFPKRMSFPRVEITGNFGSFEERQVNNGSMREDLTHHKLKLNVSSSYGKTWSRDLLRDFPKIGDMKTSITFAGLGSGNMQLLKLQWQSQNHIVISGITPNLT